MTLSLQMELLRAHSSVGLEQSTHNRQVPGSSPGGPILLIPLRYFRSRQFELSHFWTIITLLTTLMRDTKPKARHRAKARIQRKT